MKSKSLSVLFGNSRHAVSLSMAVLCVLPHFLYGDREGGSPQNTTATSAQPKTASDRLKELEGQWRGKTDEELVNMVIQLRRLTQKPSELTAKDLATRVIQARALEHLLDERFKAADPNSENGKRLDAAKKAAEARFTTLRSVYDSRPQPRTAPPATPTTAPAARLQQNPPTKPVAPVARSSSGGGMLSGTWDLWCQTSSGEPLRAKIAFTRNGDYSDFRNPLYSANASPCKAQWTDPYLYFFELDGNGDIQADPTSVWTYDRAKRRFSISSGAVRASGNRYPAPFYNDKTGKWEGFRAYLEKPTIEGRWMRSDGNEFVFSSGDGNHFAGHLGRTISPKAGKLHFKSGEQVVKLDQTGETSFQGYILWKFVDAQYNPWKSEWRALILNLVEPTKMQDSDGNTYEPIEDRHMREQ